MYIYICRKTPASIHCSFLCCWLVQLLRTGVSSNVHLSAGHYSLILCYASCYNKFDPISSQLLLSPDTGIYVIFLFSEVRRSSNSNLNFLSLTFFTSFTWSFILYAEDFKWFPVIDSLTKRRAFNHYLIFALETSWGYYLLKIVLLWWTHVI